MKVSIWWVFLFAYMAFMYGELSSHVGEYTVSKSLEWYDPIYVMAIFAVPIWFSYEAGKEDNKHENTTPKQSM